MKIPGLHVSALVIGAILIAALGLNPKAHAVEGSEYYKEGYRPIFNPYPTDAGRGGNRPWRIRYFGPVGIGIDLKRPGMTMEIWNIEEGSPADKTGKLKKGQIIESINGVVLKDFDPRIILGNIITEAEATDGVIDLKIQGQGNVRVNIPVIGRYSPTWPLNCEKSDRIVRNLADLIAKEEKASWGSVLFLLSTGEKKDLEVARRFMKDINLAGSITWHIGYSGIGLCEYYLRTGDPSVLPVIKKWADDLRDRVYNGGWSGRGAPAAFTYSTGSGQVHASGMYAMNFLLMARLCGVEVDDHTFNTALKQFYRFGGRGNVPYGNTVPEGGFRDNGKTSGFAMAMASAAMLTPEGENSVYAQARDNSAMKAFYATNWFHAAHTGGGMGEIWHHGAMALVREKRPVQYRSYHDTRTWVMDLSRRHDGSIAIEGMDDRYNRSLTDSSGGRDWGTFFALTYTYPRKQLQLWGAPRSPHAKTYQLPERPWGTAADDAFNSPEPIYISEAVKLTQEELLREKVPTHASIPAIDIANDPKTTEREMFKYLLHPEYGLRVAAMRGVVRQGWSHLVVPMLKSSDPRLRELGLLGMTGMFKGGAFSGDKLTPEMFDLVEKILNDPDESWWVTLHAAKALARADKKRIGSNRDRLMQLLRFDEEWVQTEAVLTLCRIATEEEHYTSVLPAIIATACSFKIDGVSWRSTNAIQNTLRGANPKVKAYADPYVKRAFVSIPDQLIEPNTGAVMNRGAKTVRSRISSIIQELPGGPEFVRRIPKTTTASYRSGRDSDMYQYSGKFEPNEPLIGTWKWAIWPPANRPEEIDERIQNWLKSKLKDGKVEIQGSKDTLKIEPNGKTSKSRYYRNHFWSGNMLVGIDEDQALSMEVRTHGGIDFLAVEHHGKFVTGPDDEGTEAVPADWHPGYNIYMRAE